MKLKNTYMDFHKVKMSKQDRNTLEQFMEWPDGYLSEWVTWNDIMPVCERICEIDNCADMEMVEAEGYSDLQIVHNTSILCHLKAVCERVLEFVKWVHSYNEPVGE